MWMRLIVIILSTLCALGCTNSSFEALPNSAFLSQDKNDYSLQPFNQIDVHGKINLNLTTGSAKHEVILRGDTRDINQVTIYVANNTLYLHANPGYPSFGAVSAEVRGKFLNSLTYQGEGNINGKNLNSGLLNLNITNPGKTRLAGKLNLHKLVVHGAGCVQIDGINSRNLQFTMSGNPKIKLTGVANISHLDLAGAGKFAMYWVKSNHLTIHAHDKVVIELAGITKKLDIELWDAAHFKGRYLRAHEVFVKTYNQSIAEITALNKQHFLASDESDIYYYKKPDMSANYMAFDGTVLPMQSEY